MSDSGANLTARVYHELREEILKGTYAPGTALTELGLAEALGVSRTPVREALRQLELCELVKITPNKGAVVLGITTDDIRDIYEIRSLIEGIAAERAAKEASEDQIRQLCEIIDLTEFYYEKGYLDQLQSMDGRFHTYLYGMSNGRMLRHILNDLHSYVGRFRGMSIKRKGRVEQMLKEHRAVMDAIRNHDGASARARMTEHVINSMNNIIQLQQMQSETGEQDANSDL